MEREKAFWELLREGQTCEVMTPKNDLIFLGKIHLTERRALVEVTQATGLPVPPVLYNTRLKLKLYFSSADIRILEAFVCGSTRYFWRLDHLRPLHARELRENFRQQVSAEGKLRRIQRGGRTEEGGQDGGDEPRPCKLVDLSLGGANLRCKVRYAVGDWLEITDVVLSGQRPFSFTGQVCWFQENSPGELAYGFRFVDMDIREQDRLLQTIFELQRKELKSRKGSRQPG